MPIYNGMLPAIDKAEVKRYAGLRHAEDFPQQYVDEACKEIQLLATPKVYIKNTIMMQKQRQF